MSPDPFNPAIMRMTYAEAELECGRAYVLEVPMVIVKSSTRNTHHNNSPRHLINSRIGSHDEGLAEFSSEGLSLPEFKTIGDDLGYEDEHFASYLAFMREQRRTGVNASR